ncbi:unnamed protein product, partial [Urochloa humidicola]
AGAAYQSADTGSEHAASGAGWYSTAKGPAVELLWPARAMVGVLRSSPEWQR